MAKPFQGVRVLELAAWTFVPAAGAILADLGADVIKVEPPSGDPQRGLQNALRSDDPTAANPFVEIPNRGKRSITLDLSSNDGRDLALDLALEDLLDSAAQLVLGPWRMNFDALSRRVGSVHGDDSPEEGVLGRRVCFVRLERGVSTSLARGGTAGDENHGRRRDQAERDQENYETSNRCSPHITSVLALCLLCSVRLLNVTIARFWQGPRA